MSSLRILLLSLVPVLAPLSSLSQGPPCLPSAADTSYFLPFLSAPPSPEPPMSAEVQTAYVAIGDMHRTANYDSAWRYFNGLSTISDSLRTLMRIFYVAQDHDPFLFRRVMSVPGPPNKRSLPSFGFERVLETVASASPEAALDYQLMRSSLILHIRCESIGHDTVFDGVGGLDNPLFVTTVHALIVDPVKGRQVPPCPASSGIDGERRSRPLPALMRLASYHAEQADSLVTVAATPGGCVDFHYAGIWGIHDPYDDPWIKPGREYVVFLHVILLCRDAYGDFVNLRPAGGTSRTFRLFPVDQGVVQMPDDELEIGAEAMPVAEFKEILRTRIEEIRSW
jgi:hypothetical protein